MIHLLKLAVGVRDPLHLAEIQRRRAQADPPLRHHTRNAPRRAAELADGGSIYWVIQGAVLVRQRVLDVIEDTWDDGSPCCGLVLDPALIRVEARPMKPFQGWRYMTPEDAPRDLAAARDAGREAVIGADLPEGLRRALRELALLP